MLVCFMLLTGKTSLTSLFICLEYARIHYVVRVSTSAILCFLPYEIAHSSQLCRNE